MATKIRKLKETVETILRDEPYTRDSDIALTIEIWKRFYPEYIKQGSTGKLGVWLDDLYNLPREDNVKRVRAHFQNELGKYLPTSWVVAKQRRINEDTWKAYMGSVHKFIPGA